MGRLTVVDNPRRYPLRLSGHTFDLVVEWAADNRRSVNGELVALIEEALDHRAKHNEERAA